MKTIEVDIPSRILDFIRSLDRDEKIFAAEAIEEKVDREERHDLEPLLKEGYQSTASEDLSIANDFSAADFENL